MATMRTKWLAVAAYARAKAGVYDTMNDDFRALAKELRALARHIEREQRATK